jgi:hypothetical protein
MAGKRKKGGKRKRPPIDKFPEFKIKLGVTADLALESDRGCVLVAVSAIDEALVKLLKTLFANTSAPNDTTDKVSFLLE